VPMHTYHWQVPRIVQPRTFPLCNSHPDTGKFKPIVRKSQRYNSWTDADVQLLGMKFGIISTQRLNSRLEAFFGFISQFLAQVDRGV
jgi:hypothetical protein